jgi:hypothetical protein
VNDVLYEPQEADPDPAPYDHDEVMDEIWDTIESWRK